MKPTTGTLICPVCGETARKYTINQKLCDKMSCRDVRAKLAAARQRGYMPDKLAELEQQLLARYGLRQEKA